MSGLPYPIQPDDQNRQSGVYYPPYPYPGQPQHNAYPSYPTNSAPSPYPTAPSAPYPDQHGYPGTGAPTYPGPYPGSAPMYPAKAPDFSPYPVSPNQGFPMPDMNTNVPYPNNNNSYRQSSGPYPDPTHSPYPSSNPNPHSSPYPSSVHTGNTPYPSSPYDQNVDIQNKEGKRLSGILNQGLQFAVTKINENLPINIPINIPFSHGGSSSGQRQSSTFSDGINKNQYPTMHQTTNYSSTSTSSLHMKKFANQDYESLKRHCQSSRRLFEDPSFPASNRLLVDDKSQFIVSYFGRSNVDANSIEWLRPSEICSRLNLRQGPKMFVGKIDRFDINQGEIGNCWFLAALANLAENKKCFYRVVPPEQDFEKNYAGIFRFRFWRFGGWEEVVIDDRLPTRRGQLIYLRSVEKNEFWGALLEKAYAKLNGSYRALEGGLTIEAAVDFTGGIPELIELTNSKLSPEKLFLLMLRASEANAFMGCALSASRAREAQQLGLQARHAYTITNVIEIRSRNVRSGIPLVRLRNPHGNSKEWRGDWSDEDRNWKLLSSEQRNRLGLTFEDDGEFYMSFRDFLKFFGELEICHLNPDTLDTDDNSKKFEVFHFFGSWISGVSSGGCGNDGHRHFATNPQFFLNLNDPDPYDDERACPVVISLLQQQEKRKSEHAIGFKVYKCDQTARALDERFFSQNQPTDRIDSFINLREVSKRMVLSPGRYCIVPCTFHKGEQGDFLLRVFTQTKWGSSEIARGQMVNNAGLNDGPTSSITDGIRNIGISPHPRPGSYTDGASAVDGFKKKNKIAGFALRKLEEQFPSGMKNLNTFFNWAKDRESEYAILQNIVKTLQHK